MPRCAPLPQGRSRHPHTQMSSPRELADGYFLFGVPTMKQKTLLATAIAAALVLQTWSVAAQDAAPAQAEQSSAKSLETVTVTGSRIRSVDVETSQPVFTMDKAAIQATGLTNVNDILARMPSAGTPDITPQDTLSSGADVGGRYVNI